MNEQTEATALRKLHPLYVEMRDSELSKSDNPESNQVQTMADALSEAVGRPLDQDADTQELRRLVAYMRAYTRIDLCRARLPKDQSRRPSIEQVLTDVANHAGKLEATLRKLLEVSIRDVFSGAPLDIPRLTVARELYTAMGRGWMEDIDLEGKLGQPLADKVSDHLPEFKFEEMIPTLTSSLNSLVRLTKTAKKLTVPEDKWRPSINRGRDVFVMDVAASYTVLTGDIAIAWDRPDTGTNSPFMVFFAIVWSRLDGVPLDGHMVDRNGMPNARTVQRILSDN